MRKRINLFKAKKDYSSKVILLKKIKVGTIIVSGLIFLIFLYLNFQLLQLRKDFQNIDLEKQKQLSYLLDNKSSEAKLQYFKSKENQIIQFNKDDAHFSPYYQVLQTSFLPASNSSTLDSIEIDKERNVSFIVKLKDLDSSLSFIRYVESNQFLNNFTQLVLSNVNLTKAYTANKTDNQETLYQFSFKGKFKEIHDITF